MFSSYPKYHALYSWGTQLNSNIFTRLVTTTFRKGKFLNQLNIISYLLNISLFIFSKGLQSKIA